MKKSILILALFTIFSLFVSCSFPLKKAEHTESTGSSAATQAVQPSPSAPTAAPESATPSVPAAVSATPVQSPAAAAETQPDSSLTLSGMKQAALSAGYEVDVVQDFQMPDEPKPTDSFNLIYKDENTEAQIPIFEFKNSADALAYAKVVNEEGYNLCIVNGKFLTMTGVRYGIPSNENETKVLETLLKSKVMEFTAPSPSPLISAEDYAGACIQIDIIYKALDEFVNKSVLLYDKSAAEDQNIENAFVTFSLVSSGDLAFTASLGENQAQLDAVKQLWEMFGVTGMKITHDKANDYILTGKRAGLDTSFVLHCSFDPATESLRLTDADGGKAVELFEFVPLGADKYAFQTLYERAIVGYKDGTVTSVVYSLNKRDEAHMYNAETNGIYLKSALLDEAWVSKAGEDSYDQFITYDGALLKIAADSMLGSRLTVEIPVK